MSPQLFQMRMNTPSLRGPIEGVAAEPARLKRLQRLPSLIDTSIQTTCIPWQSQHRRAEHHTLFPGLRCTWAGRRFELDSGQLGLVRANLDAVGGAAPEGVRAGLVPVQLLEHPIVDLVYHDLQFITKRVGLKRWGRQKASKRQKSR